MMNLKDNYIDFQNEISSRGIEHLIHFTPTINLLSIFEQNKLLSRDLLEKFDIEQTDIFDYIEFTDDIRFDDKSYINLSIQHPNSFLFNRFREKTKEDAHVNWCVLKLTKNLSINLTHYFQSRMLQIVTIKGTSKLLVILKNLKCYFLQACKLLRPIIQGQFQEII